MNERRCKPEHLRPYQGVLSSEVQKGKRRRSSRTAKETEMEKQIR